jgi:hypothetical protein
MFTECSLNVDWLLTVCVSRCPKISTWTIHQLLQAGVLGGVKRLRLRLRSSKKGSASLFDIKPNIVFKALADTGIAKVEWKHTDLTMV